MVTCGRMKSRMDMKIAGVADPTVTFNILMILSLIKVFFLMMMANVADHINTVESRRVVTLKASPHPGMKIGVLKNHRAMRMTKRTRTYNRSINAATHISFT